MYDVEVSRTNFIALGKIAYGYGKLIQEARIEKRNDIRERWGVFFQKYSFWSIEVECHMISMFRQGLFDDEGM